MLRVMHQRPQHPRTPFGTKLYNELERQKVTNRELARRLAPNDPVSMRRSIARWLGAVDNENTVEPNEASRRSVETALGLDAGTLSDDPDEEDSLAPIARAFSEMFTRSVQAAVDRALSRENVA